MKIPRMFRTKIFTVFLLVACITVSFAAACTPRTRATYVRLDREEVTVHVGEKVILYAETDGFGIKWSSDAIHIATVDDGEVTAVAAGEATVKVRVGDVSAYCEITVLEKEPEKPVDPEKPEEPVKPPLKEGDLCELYEHLFVIGAAVQTDKLTGNRYGNLMTHFNSISPENNMKWKNIENVKGVYNFNQSGDSADKLITWAKNNGVGVRGHCLLWYKSLPEWLHDEFEGKAYSESLKNTAYSYIDGHIEQTMEHFGDDVYVWDVVNEALFNSVSASNLTVTASEPYGNIWRTDDNMNDTDSDWVDWFKVCGGYEYIARAFKKADEIRKANNLGVELYYNDYSLNNPYKRQACLNLIKMLHDNNAPIDGIGMQAHYKLDDFTANKTQWIKEFEASVKSFIDAGVDVQITELDIRFDGPLTEQKEAAQAEMYGKILEVCRKYAKTAGKEHGITGLTFWGVHDGCNESWGKDKYPLIFGTDKLPKKAYYEIINF